MNKEKKLLLWGVIIGVLSTILIYVVELLLVNIMPQLFEGEQIAVNDSQLLVSNIISYALYLMGIIYFLILIINKKIDLNNHTTGILIWSIILLLSNIITGIFGFIVYSRLEKREKEKRQLPVIEYKEFTNKFICLFAFVICMLLMFVLPNFVRGFIASIVIYVLILGLMIGVFFNQLKHDFKIFKEYFKEYMSLTIKTWLKSLVVMMILGIILQLLTNMNQSNNQQELQDMFNVYPILIVVLSMFYAPFAEELMFRGVFRKFIKSKYLFIIISGVAFGLLHVIDDSKTLAEFSYVFVYSALGMYLAGLYYKTNNLFTNISFHFMQNTLGVLGMILLYFMG